MSSRSRDTYLPLPLSDPSAPPPPAFRKSLTTLNAYERHIKFVNDYMFHYQPSSFLDAQKKREASAQGKSEVEILKEHHTFLRDEDEDQDEQESWEKRLAKKYYDKLFKEYCLADLSRYQEGKIAMRWRTQKEVLDGMGQFSCGNLRCPSGFNVPPKRGAMFPSGSTSKPQREEEKGRGLKSWEVPFAYKEHGTLKNALVKLRLCEGCGGMLNYKKDKERRKRKEKEERRETSKKRRREKRESESEEREEEEEEGKEPSTSAGQPEHREQTQQPDPLAASSASSSLLPSGTYSKQEASKIWSSTDGESLAGVGAKSQEEEMDEFFEGLFE
ncbi:hypothetical protein HDV05_007988 [Chytridiales sp. JEL 0842]|nr:hypothetical protein HDV05_007988 [Chytridiales sp. JEL 0842]